METERPQRGAAAKAREEEGWTVPEGPLKTGPGA